MPRLRIEPQEQFPPARRDSLSMIDCRPSRISAAALEFGRFRVELRRRELLADGAPIELGTRAFELLLVLLEADGSLVTKQELQSRVWPGIVVAEENLKVQISALRRALGKDREFIRTEFGRGYRFTAAVRSTGCWSRIATTCGCWRVQESILRCVARRIPPTWSRKRFLKRTSTSSSSTARPRRS